MNYWNKRLTEAAEYIPGEQPANLDEYIKLNTNESPFPPSKAILEAVKSACNENLRRYPDPAATEVRKVFAKDNDLLPDNVFVANGSDEIFTLLFRGFVEPDGIAAFPYPSYSLYYTLSEMNGIAYEKINLKNDFSYDLIKFLKKKYDLIIISNPNNPTGTYCDVDDIRSFLGKFRGLLVVDEAYIDFYGGSSTALIREFENLIVTRSFSKSYSLAGLRVGLALSSPGVIRGFIKIKDSYNIDRLAIAGAKAALLDRRGFAYNMEMLRNNKEYLEERLAGLGFGIVPSRANFIFVRHPEIEAREIYEKLKRKKILVRYFDGPMQSEHLRISVGTMMEIKALCSELGSIIP